MEEAEPVLSVRWTGGRGLAWEEWEEPVLSILSRGGGGSLGGRESAEEKREVEGEERAAREDPGRGLAVARRELATLSLAAEAGRGRCFTGKAG